MYHREVPLLLPARGSAPGGAGRCYLARRHAGSTPETTAAAFRGRGASGCDSQRDDVGSHPVREPAHLGAAGDRAGLHRLQLHGAAARGRPSHDLRAPPAARREASTYEPSLQHAIAAERRVSILFHLSALAIIWYAFGFYAALRTSIIPVFFIFPIAFTLNRLGQYYDIDPSDPAKWGTLMRGHWFW